jgi:hypothetical protein
MEALTQLQTFPLAMERMLIPLLFAKCDQIPSLFREFALIDLTNPANFDWCLRKLLEALNID